MIENLYWIIFGAVLALGAFWLFMMWFRAPKDSRWPRGPK